LEAYYFNQQSLLVTLKLDFINFHLFESNWLNALISNFKLALTHKLWLKVRVINLDVTNITTLWFNDSLSFMLKEYLEFNFKVLINNS